MLQYFETSLCSYWRVTICNDKRILLLASFMKEIHRLITVSKAFFPNRNWIRTICTVCYITLRLIQKLKSRSLTYIPLWGIVLSCFCFPHFISKGNFGREKVYLISVQDAACSFALMFFRYLIFFFSMQHFVCKSWRIELLSLNWIFSSVVGTH